MNEPTTTEQTTTLAQTTSQAIMLAGAVLDKRIATAKQWPRSVTVFKHEAAALLSEDVETARSAEYKKPVGSGTVTGPSIRLAEIAALCWRNIEVEILEPVITETAVTTTAYAWDLERNVRMPGISTLQIVYGESKSNKQNNLVGKRYPQHMIETTVLNTASRARRNAICAVIPRAYVNSLLEVAREVASANRPPLEEVRHKMLEFFARSHRVTPEQIFAYLEVSGIDDVTYEHIDDLRAVLEAIKEGESPEIYFGKTKTKAEQVAEKMAKRKGEES